MTSAEDEIRLELGRKIAESVEWGRLLKERVGVRPAGFAAEKGDLGLQLGDRDSRGAGQVANKIGDFDRAVARVVSGLATRFHEFVRDRKLHRRSHDFSPTCGWCGAVTVGEDPSPTDTPDDVSP